MNSIELQAEVKKERSASPTASSPASSKLWKPQRDSYSLWHHTSPAHPNRTRFWQVNYCVHVSIDLSAFSPYAAWTLPFLPHTVSSCRNHAVKELEGSRESQELVQRHIAVTLTAVASRESQTPATSIETNHNLSKTRKGMTLQVQPCEVQSQNQIFMKPIPDTWKLISF